MKIKLSDRMQKIADMVIPAYLLQNKICSEVILTDIAEGPLEKALHNLTEYGFSTPDLRLGAGLHVLKASEVSTVIIAGMGGELIRDILLEDPEKSKTFQKLILQPRTRSDEMRLELQRAGFSICDYALAEERGRICEIIAYNPKPSEETENAVFSEFLLRKKDPLLQKFIDYKIKQRTEIINELKKAEENQTKKILLLEEEIHYLKNLV